MHRHGVNIGTAVTLPLNCVETCDTNAPRSSETAAAKLLHYASRVRVPSSKRGIKLREDPDNIRRRNVAHLSISPVCFANFSSPFQMTPVVDDFSRLRCNRKNRRIKLLARGIQVWFSFRRRLSSLRRSKSSLCGKSKASERRNMSSANRSREMERVRVRKEEEEGGGRKSIRIIVVGKFSWKAVHT